jgi:hypothetical protein
MTDAREHPVRDSAAHAHAVGEYRRDGYQITDDGPGETTLRYQDGGGVLAHLALFFTVGWLTLGVLNWWYARRRKKRTRDTVRVVTQS